jgi:hypothetical protein
VDTGYADQAHMCREIHALAGKTPQFLLRDGSRSTLTMSDLFNTPDLAAFYNTPNETEHRTIRRQP